MRDRILQDVFMSNKDEVKAEKIKRIEEIKNLLHGFCDEYLNENLESFCFHLVDNLSKKRIINIHKGKIEIWAASIIYVIARLNFLFDKSNDYYIRGDVIFNHFNAKKTTVSNKARDIEDKCNLSIGSESVCSREITEAFTFYETPEGFIIPLSMFNGNNIEVETANDEESEEIRKHLDQKKRDEELGQEIKKKRRDRVNKSKKEKEKKEKESKQLTLF